MKTTTGNNYRKRLTKVLDYIYQHLDGDLDVNTLAEVASMSPYHFHRIYREMAQETINVAVRRLRLQNAASELIRTDLPLTTIAKNISYQSHEAFSRAFIKEFGESPSDYRKSRHISTARLEPFIAMLPSHSQKEYDNMFAVEINELSELSVVGYEHRGDYMDIGKSFERIFQYSHSHDLLNDQTRSIGIYYHDPKSVETDELRSVACISVTSPLALGEESDPINLTIPGGKFATLLFKGSYAELEKPYDWLFGKWLPESGMEAANFPPFEEYLNDPKTTPPSELLTRIHCLLA